MHQTNNVAPPHPSRDGQFADALQRHGASQAVFLQALGQHLRGPWANTGNEIALRYVTRVLELEAPEMTHDRAIAVGERLGVVIARDLEVQRQAARPMNAEGVAIWYQYERELPQLGKNLIHLLEQSVNGLDAMTQAVIIGMLSRLEQTYPSFISTFVIDPLVRVAKNDWRPLAGGRAADTLSELACQLPALARALDDGSYNLPFRRITRHLQDIAPLVPLCEGAIHGGVTAAYEVLSPLPFPEQPKRPAVVSRGGR